MPKISIVMPTYNQAEFIKEAIDSVLAQTFKDFELIVVDDGSSDTTVDILKTYSDPRIRFIQKENGGTGSALNAGFAVARGEYETWFSSDNVMYPEMFEKFNAFLDAHQDVDYVYAAFDFSLMDAGGHKRSYTKHSSKIISQEWQDGKLFNNYFLGIAWLWRRSLRERCGKFQTEPCEDYDMTLRMYEAGCRFVFLNETLAWYRQHDKNMTKRVPLSVVSQIKAKSEERRKSWRLRKIPKIAHFYWGNNKLSYLRYLTLYSFHLYNPDWEIRLWLSKSVNLTPTWNTFENGHTYDGQDYLPVAKSLPIKVEVFDVAQLGVRSDIHEIYKSDFLRWYFLSHYGGLWSDMDVLYLKPMRNFIFNSEVNQDLDTLVCSCQWGYSIGFLMSSPGNVFFRYIFKKAKSNFHPKFYQSAGSQLFNSEFKTVDSIRDKHGVKVYNLPMDILYAYCTHEVTEELFRPGGRMLLTKSSLGIHWYAGHPEAGKFENEVTEQNACQYDTIMGRALRHILKNDKIVEV